jgi:transposase
MGRVIIGIDPHKRSATIEVINDREKVLDQGRSGETVARVRVFDTGQGRKTDPVDAHSVAVAASRANGLRQVAVDDATVASRLLADRRDGLGHARTDTINRLHRTLKRCRTGTRPASPTCRPSGEDPS